MGKSFGEESGEDFGEEFDGMMEYRRKGRKTRNETTSEFIANRFIHASSFIASCRNHLSDEFARFVLELLLQIQIFAKFQVEATWKRLHN
jgi:hypothetical protein